MVNQETQVLEALCSPNAVTDTHPRTRASQEPTDHRQKCNPEMDGSPQTLKLLVVSVVQRRSALLSSKGSK
jgi:hypothetical protein